MATLERSTIINGSSNTGLSAKTAIVSTKSQLTERLRARDFWLAQGMVIGITIIHMAIDGTASNDVSKSLHHITPVLYIVPVVFASFRFGLEGGVLTAVWSGTLAVPNFIIFHRSHFDWIGESLATLMVITVGLALGSEVERQRALHRRVDQYAAGLAQACEQERLRVAEEVHDDSIQSLILVVRRVDAMLNGDEGLGGEGLRGIRAGVESCIDGLRRLCANLRPVVLEHLGLTASVRRLVQDFAVRTGIPVSCEVSGLERPLDRDKELAVFRVVQEALTNVEKHAGATKVSARIVFARNGLSISIGDDGRGFSLADSEAKRRGAGEQLGILGMEERARLVGGQTVIASVLGRGTVVTVSVPS